jgi:methionine-gamma-lyase
MGLSPGLLRLSVGYTGSLQSRLEQIERAVRKVGLVTAKRRSSNQRPAKRK